MYKSDAKSLAEAVKPADRGSGSAPDEHSLARQQFLLCMRAYDSGHKEWMAEKEMFNGFYKGGKHQWKPEDIARLDAEKRPWLSLNMVKPTVNIVLGEQITRRVDIQYKAQHTGRDDAAEALTHLALTVNEQNQFHWEESAMFADGLIEDRGYLDVRMDYNDNIHGDVRVVSVDGGEIMLDPDDQDYDPQRWSGFFRVRWMSVAKIAEEYGEQWATKLSSLITSGEHFGIHSIKRMDNRFGDTDKEESGRTSFDLDDKDQTDISLYRVMVIERQFYQNVKTFSLVDLRTGALKKLPSGTSREEAQQLATQFGAGVFQRVERRVRWRVTADQFVLKDEWSPYRSFTIIPYFPYFRRGSPTGIVRDLISPQEQYNKLCSQELHIVNTTANSGYVVETGALSGMTADDLRTVGSQTGVVIEVNPGKLQSIEKIKPNPIPTGIDRLSLKAQASIKEISMVNDAMRGDVSAEVSGVALESRERRAQTSLQVPLDNLARTRYLYARKLKELFQDFYTAERIVQITDEADPQQPRKTQVINEVQDDGSVAKDVTVGDYDIVISSKPANDTMRDAQFAEVMAMRQAGIMIPDYRVVQVSHMQHKDEIAQELQQMAGLGEKSPEQMDRAMRAAEAELADAESEVAKKRAQAKELESRIALNRAKAYEAATKEERERAQREFQDTLDRRNSGLRRELAVLDSVNKLDSITLQGQQQQLQALEQRREPTPTKSDSGDK